MPVCQAAQIEGLLTYSLTDFLPSWPLADFCFTAFWKMQWFWVSWTTTTTIYNIHQHSIILTKQHLLSKKLTEKTQIYRILQQGSAKNFIIYRIYSHKMQPQATINQYGTYKCPPHSVRKRKFFLKAPWLPIAALGRSVGSWREWSNYQFPPWLRRHMSRHYLGPGRKWNPPQKNTFLCFLLSTILEIHNVRWHLLQLLWFPYAWYTNCPMAFFSLRHSTNPISQVGSGQIGKQQKVLLVCPRDPQFQKIDEYMKREPRSF